MATRKREATIFSYKVILDNEGKLITEITTLPVEDEKVMKDAFSRSREERMFYTSLVKEAKRKLLPALYRLDKADLLPDNARIASVARHQISTNIYLNQVQENLQQVIPKKEWDNKVWTRFKRRIYDQFK